MSQPTHGEVAASSNSSPSTATGTVPAAASAEKPAHIVLVDDDDLFRESLGLNLLDEGYTVVSFSAGQPALDYFANGGGADAILLDWRMPGMNGLEVLRQLRRS